jgi:hypothetical protein
MGNIILVKRISRAIAEVLRLENQIQGKEKRTAFVNFKVKQIFYVIIFVTCSLFSPQHVLDTQ